jgi:hypothetical protein
MKHLNSRRRIFQPGRVSGGGVYLGQAATRCAYPDGLSTVYRQAMSLSGHIATSNIAGLQLVLTNSYAGATEVADGADTTVTAGIEYPIGTTPVLVTFGGGASGTIPNGQLLLSDWCPMTIPKGALFRVRIWRSNSAGIAGAAASAGHSFALWGDSLNRSATTTPDLTLSTSIPSDNGGGGGYQPCAILTYTREPSVGLLGDSRITGDGDTVDAAGALGLAARSLAPHIGWISLARSGTTVLNFNNSHTNRLQVAGYCSHLIVGYPLNDFAASAGLSAVQSRMQTLWGLFPNHTIFQLTCEPSATSASGNWTSDGDQTAQSYTVPNLAQFNDWVRGLPTPVKRCFDSATVLSSVTDRTKWASDGSNKKYTNDGIHANQFGNIQVALSGVIDLKAIRRAA